MGPFAPAVEETHISVLVLLGDRAFKLKKPVQFPFLDWRDRQAREAACHREVALNRRLAPDVYLDVADVVSSDGEPLDHLVVMRRMPADRRLSLLVRAGVDVRADLEDVARLVASFHDGAARSPATVEAASRDAVLANWNDNLATLRDVGGSVVGGEVVDLVERLATRYLAGRAPLFVERARMGYAVDGHGDLLADDIYVLDDGPRVLDCLEFSDRLRAVDVLDDVASLAMDLERLGAPALGVHFVSAYGASSGVPFPPSLLDHYIAYRAGVRSKVACLRASDSGDDAAVAARRLLLLARDHLAEAAVKLVLVGGLPGTGKTTVAAGLAQRTGARVLRSDVVRKRLAGADASTPMASPYGTGIYDASTTHRTYERMLEEARHLLERGESVVLDASWAAAERRRDAEALAAATSSDLVALKCVAPSDVAAGRLRRRAGDASDADARVARAMAADFTPWPEAIELNTSRSAEATVEAALAAVAAAVAVDQAEGSAG